MAEAFGVLANCIAVIELCGKVYKFAEEHIHTSTAIRAEIVPILAKLVALEGLIRGIKVSAELDGDEHDRLKVLQHIDQPLKACAEALKELQETFSKSQSKQKLFFGKLISTKTSNALKRLDDTVPILQLALSADEKTILNVVAQYMRKLDSDLHDFKMSTEAQLQKLDEQMESFNDFGKAEAARNITVDNAAQDARLRLLAGSI